MIGKGQKIGVLMKGETEAEWSGRKLCGMIIHG